LKEFEVQSIEQTKSSKAQTKSSKAQTKSSKAKTLKKVEEKLSDKEVGYNKKEKLNLERQRLKFEHNLGGIKNMGGYPDLVIIIDTNKESLAIAEAKKLNIPIMALVDPEFKYNHINGSKLNFKFSSSLKNGYFRWFDSGDLQDVNHLKAIIKIANELPTIKFWLPTKEHNLLKDVFIRQGIQCPDNLIIRLSSNYIDQAPSTQQFLTSTVFSHGNQPIGQACIAPSQDGKCLDCRACWNKSIPTISYAEH
jgi:hypothetical protein